MGELALPLGVNHLKRWDRIVSLTPYDNSPVLKTEDINVHTEVEGQVSAQITLEPSVKDIDSHLKAACDAAEWLLSQKSPDPGYSL